MKEKRLKSHIFSNSLRRASNSIAEPVPGSKQANRQPDSDHNPKYSIPVLIGKKKKSVPSKFSKIQKNQISTKISKIQKIVRDMPLDDQKDQYILILS